MRRADLAHLLRAAARIAGDPNILVIGSQAILAAYGEDELPHEAWLSVEADLAFLDDPASGKADQVDGAIGELSLFHETHSYYAHGVDATTAVLPRGWRDRVVPFDDDAAAPEYLEYSRNTSNMVGWQLADRRSGRRTLRPRQRCAGHASPQPGTQRWSGQSATEDVRVGGDLCRCAPSGRDKASACSGRRRTSATRGSAGRQPCPSPLHDAAQLLAATGVVREGLERGQPQLGAFGRLTQDAA